MNHNIYSDMIYRDLPQLIDAARGDIPADLVLTNVQLVNTLAGLVEKTSVAVKDGFVIGLGDYEAQQVHDCNNAFLCPGFIESHIHIESTLLAPPEFAKAVAQRGTCTVVCDPHEIANVMGTRGIEYFLQSSSQLPISIFLTLPSCVPATHLENAGALLDHQELQDLLEKYSHRFAGLGEMMNFPGVVYKDPQVLAKLEMAANIPIDGHAPGLSGLPLNAYILAGPGSDHECTTLKEAREKLSKGMFIMIREGSSAKNTRALLPLVNDSNWPGFSLVSDDRHPEDLIRQGHIDHNLRCAVKMGLDPVRAVQLVTINPARYFNFKRRGAIAPGYRADMVLLRNLHDFEILDVYTKGRRLEDNSFISPAKMPGNSMRICKITEQTFAVPVRGTAVRAIEIIAEQVITGSIKAHPVIKDGFAWSAPDQDLIKLAVIERHKQTGNVGLGFVKGLGLSRGALASTVAHDSHNLIIAGANDSDMLVAALKLTEMGGGLCAVDNGHVLAALPLPIAGLMSDQPLEKVVELQDNLNLAIKEMGINHQSPLMTLSFLALPVIPSLKLTDKGLVDVDKFEIIDLWI
ncbi:adenine deaminase [Desulfonatronovibrio magnus]|uniref:adenine deaminase n=1 Tax=Desulfonatronovibrio magnus TaxID=698827 RepID=UPI0005EB60D0|nr:adenine deaminase [Desulfonatronovibrio magnus]